MSIPPTTQQIIPRHLAPYLDVTCAGEEVSVLVERHGHDSVRNVERLLHAVTVVHVNVNVQHARVVLEQLQNAQHDVVHVAEARPLRLLGMVQSARPVDGNIALSVVESTHSVQRAARVNLAEVEDAIEHGAVRQLAQVVCTTNNNNKNIFFSITTSKKTFFCPPRTFLQLRGEVLLVAGADSLQEVDVVGRVEGLDLLGRRDVWLLCG